MKFSCESSNTPGFSFESSPFHMASPNLGPLRAALNPPALVHHAGNVQSLISDWASPACSCGSCDQASFAGPRSRKQPSINSSGAEHPMIVIQYRLKYETQTRKCLNNQHKKIWLGLQMREASFQWIITSSSLPMKLQSILCTSILLFLRTSLSSNLCSRENVLVFFMST